jgi:GNAT superfamily N-acetyltransferase
LAGAGGAGISLGAAGVEVAGHVAVNVAEGDPALEVSTRGTGLPPERLIVVSRLFVVKAFRRQGIARALLDRAVAHAHSEGLRPVLDVLEADRAAIAFNTQAGWQRVGVIVFRSRDGEPLPGLVYAGQEPAGD